MSKSYSVEAIVLKRVEYGEADLIVTVFTKESGKISVLAKGVRKSSSNRAASIEIGTHLNAQIIHTKSMGILTQTLIINSFPNLKQDLISCTQLYQLLEVVDVLTREDQELPELFDIIKRALGQMNQIESKKDLLISCFRNILEILGFAPPDVLNEYSIKDFIESIAEKPLKSKKYLIPKTNQV